MGAGFYRFPLPPIFERKKMIVEEFIEMLKRMPQEHKVYFVIPKGAKRKEAELQRIHLFPPSGCQWIDLEIK